MTEQTGPNPVPPAEEKPSRRTGRLSWRWAGDIVPNYWEPGLIDGLVEKKAQWIMYGESGSGKTAVTVDLACRIAAGMDWRGHKTQQGLVIYVAAENPFSTEKRIWAWQKLHKVDALPLVVVESPLALGESGYGELTALVAEVRAETGMVPVLVVLDTLARTMPGDENKTQDMSEYVRWADEIKINHATAVLIIHHTGKDTSRGARGSSALKAATDHEWEVFRDGEERGIKMTKVREGEAEGKVFGFKLESRAVGVNAWGREVTTPIAVEADAPVGGGKGAARAEQAALIEAYIRGQGGRATIEELMAEFGALATGAPESNRRAWRRLITRHFREAGGYVLLRGAE